MPCDGRWVVLPPAVYEDEMPDGHEIKKRNHRDPHINPLDKRHEREAELHSFQRRHANNPFHPDDRRHVAWDDGWESGWREYKRFCDERLLSITKKRERDAQRLDTMPPVRRGKVSATKG